MHDNPISLKRLYSPLLIGLAFLVFTEVSYFLGPIMYNTKRPGLLVFYLFIVNVALYLGYRNKIHFYLRNPNVFSNKSFDGLNWVYICIIIAVLTIPIKIYVGWNLSSFSVGEAINKFLVGLSSPNEVYNAFLDSSSSSPLRYLQMALSPFVYMAIPCGVYRYKDLRPIFRLFVIVLIVIEIVYCIGLGIRKRMLDTILITFFPFVAARNNRKQVSHKLLFILFGIIALAGLIYYFIYSHLARIGVSDVTFFMYGEIKPWYQIHFPEELYVPFADIQFYLTHAYENLSMALDYQFSSITSDNPVFTFGLGNNSFVLDTIMNSYLGIDLTPYTYQHILNEIYHKEIGLQWMTIYPWFANDVTFFGVPFVIYYMGKLYARFWIESVYHYNIFSIPLFCFVVITVFYSFANNQALSYSFIPIVVLTVLYGLSKRKHR